MRTNAGLWVLSAGEQNGEKKSEKWHGTDRVGCRTIRIGHPAMCAKVSRCGAIRPVNTTTNVLRKCRHTLGPKKHGTCDRCDSETKIWVLASKVPATTSIPFLEHQCRRGYEVLPPALERFASVMENPCGVWPQGWHHICTTADVPGSMRRMAGQLGGQNVHGTRAGTKPPNQKLLVGTTPCTTTPPRQSDSLMPHERAGGCSRWQDVVL